METWTRVQQHSTTNEDELHNMKNYPQKGKKHSQKSSTHLRDETNSTCVSKKLSKAMRKVLFARVAHRERVQRHHKTVDYVLR